MKKVYAVVKSDYDEFMTVYVCNEENIATWIADKLNERERFFTRRDKPSDKVYPGYLVIEHPLLEKAVLRPFPKYANIIVNYIAKGAMPLIDCLEFRYPRSIDECYHEDKHLPSFAKDVIVRIANDEEGLKDNNLEFSMFIPIYEDDTLDDVNSRCIELAISSIRTLNDKGYTMDTLLHGDVTKFNMQVHEYGGLNKSWYIALTTFPNILMADAKVDRTDDFNMVGEAL